MSRSHNVNISVNSRDNFKGDGLRYLAAGLFNTALTFLVYQALLFVASPNVSYAVAWLIGLCFVVIFYPGRVFAGGGKSRQHRLWLALSYIFVFLTGMVLLNLMSAINIQPRVSIFLVMFFTTVANFFLGRFLNYLRTE